MGSDGAGSIDGLTLTATSPDVAVLDEARSGFHRTRPRQSAKRVFYFTQLFAFSLLVVALIWATRVAPQIAWNVFHFAALALFTSAVAWRLAAASMLTPILSRLAEPANWPVYTLLCPLYREAAVVPDLLAAISRLDYPREALDIKVLVEGDDVDTIAAFAVAAAPSIEVVVIPPSTPRTKPKALNVGLSLARGDYVVVYDAEDRPHPQQLRAALAAFEDGDNTLACLQAPLAIDNAEVSWIARQFAAEYAIQFGEILPLLARLQLPLPLGGSSNHFRVGALRDIGGWDPNNVSEGHRKFANNFDELQRGTLHVPITSQSEKWSAKGLIGKEKARDRFNVREKCIAFAA